MYVALATVVHGVCLKMEVQTCFDCEPRLLSLKSDLYIFKSSHFGYFRSIINHFMLICRLKLDIHRLMEQTVLRCCQNMHSVTHKRHPGVTCVYVNRFSLGYRMSCSSPFQYIWEVSLSHTRFLMHKICISACQWNHALLLSYLSAFLTQ